MRRRFKKSRLPRWLDGRQAYLYIAVVLGIVGAMIEGGWVVWVAVLFVLCIAAFVALVLRSESS
jgi:Ca2+/Na+ antiporter